MPVIVFRKEFVSSAGRCTGAAWLSSARVVRCSVKSGNERNPRFQLPAGNAGDSGKTNLLLRWEGGDDVKSVWPLRPGLHTCYNARHNGMQYREIEQIHKTGPSSDWSLQLDSMKLESLVMAYQQRRREYVPGPCTHRPSHHESRNKVAVGEPAAGSPPFYGANLSFADK